MREAHPFRQTGSPRRIRQQVRMGGCLALIGVTRRIKTLAVPLDGFETFEATPVASHRLPVFGHDQNVLYVFGVLCRLEGHLEIVLVGNQNGRPALVQHQLQFLGLVQWVHGCDFGPAQAHRQRDGQIIDVVGSKQTHAAGGVNAEIVFEGSRDSGRVAVVVPKGPCHAGAPIEYRTAFVAVAVGIAVVLRFPLGHDEIWQRPVP